MKCKLVLVVLLWVLLTSGASCNNYAFDQLRLALRWPNTYCLEHDGACSDTDMVPQNFTISYLRPEKLADGPEMKNCFTLYELLNPTMEKYKHDLLKFWPNLETHNLQQSKAYWVDEWKRYGSCASAIMKPEDYIETALRFAEDHDLKKILKNARIVADGRSYEVRGIRSALKQGLGVTVELVCATAGGGGPVFLSEIHQCIDKDGTTLIDCQKERAWGCTRNVAVFPYMDYQPFKAPRQ